MADKATAAPAQQPTEAEMRELVVRNDMLRNQLQALETQRSYVLELLADARRSLSTMESVEKAQDGDEVLVPVGAGTFLSARLANGGKALTSIGAGVHAELPAAEATERLRARLTNLEQASSELAKDINRIADEMARISEIAESMYGG